MNDHCEVKRQKGISGSANQWGGGEGANEKKEGQLGLGSVVELWGK